MAEYFDVLDGGGNSTGRKKLRAEVHRDGDWHKAVHTWVVDGKGGILLQKRAPTKDSHPNMWDISSAGHLSAGDDSREGAVRELKEELGVDISPDQLQFLGTGKWSEKISETFVNNEFNDIYLLRLPSLDPAALKLQKEEVSEVKFVSVDEFKERIARRDPTLLIYPDEFALLFAALEEMA